MEVVLEGRDGRGSFLQAVVAKAFLEGNESSGCNIRFLWCGSLDLFFLFFSLIKSAVLFVRTPLSFSWLHLSWQFQRDEQRGSISAWGLFVTSLYFKMFCSGSECCQQLLYNLFLWRISPVVLSGLTSTRVWKGLVWWGWGWRQGADGAAAWAQPGGSEASWPQQPSLGTGTPAPAHSCSSATAANHKTGTFPALGKFVVVGSLLISPREMS